MVPSLCNIVRFIHSLTRDILGTIHPPQPNLGDLMLSAQMMSPDQQAQEQARTRKTNVLLR